MSRSKATPPSDLKVLISNLVAILVTSLTVLGAAAANI